MDAKELVKQAQEGKIKFLSLQFSDVAGAVKSIDLPVSGLEAALEDGVWFDGSSVEGFARIQESDMHLRLDPTLMLGYLGVHKNDGGQGCFATSIYQMVNLLMGIHAAPSNER